MLNAFQKNVGANTKGDVSMVVKGYVVYVHGGFGNEAYAECLDLFFSSKHKARAFIKAFLQSPDSNRHYQNLRAVNFSEVIYDLTGCEIYEPRLYWFPRTNQKVGQLTHVRRS